MQTGTTFFYAILLSAGAGLATTIGSLMGIAVKKPSDRFLAFTLGFSAGVMILISFVELLNTSIKQIGFARANIAFLIGMIIFALIDFIIPHEYVGQKDFNEKNQKPGLKRTGLLVAVGIGIHNFPEGLAAFSGALENMQLGIAIAVAIAIHNIPEGLAISAPVYAATGSRKKAFWWSFLSGVSEPVGAALGAVVLSQFFSHEVLGWLLGGVGGLMVAISLDELMPAAKNLGSEHAPVLGVIIGMVVMALSLWLLY
ncbi:zinc transporter ZupT [bacterium]|nr:zinc transporter ZupT [bacterium]